MKYNVDASFDASKPPNGEQQQPNTSESGGGGDGNMNFDVLIGTCHSAFAEVHSVAQDLDAFKDKLLTHHLPPSLLVELTCLFARLYRSFSDFNTPVNELLRLTKLYSSTWDKQTAVMQRLYRENEQKRALLNLAIRWVVVVVFKHLF